MKSCTRSVCISEDKKMFFILVNGETIWIPTDVSKFKNKDRVLIRDWGSFYEVRSTDSMYSEMSWNTKKL